MARDYTLGRGEVHFARFKPGTEEITGYRYLGNSPEFSITLESENLDHYSSERGIREKDASVVLEVARSFSLVLDEISNQNVSMFLFSQQGVDTVSALGGTTTDYEITNVIPDNSYPLGVTDANPVGALMIAFPGTGATAFKVRSGDGVRTYVAGVDYVYSPASSLLKPLKGGAIAAGDSIKVTFTELTYSYELIKSGSEPVAGALMYITYNPIGPQRKFTLPSVTIRPNGDFNMKGDEWQQLPYTGDILRKGDLEAVYVNGAPFVP